MSKRHRIATTLALAVVLTPMVAVSSDARPGSTGRPVPQAESAAGRFTVEATLTSNRMGLRGLPVLAPTNPTAVLVSSSAPGAMVAANGRGQFRKGATSPGEEGNYVITAQRTENGGPFRNLGKLRFGDTVTVQQGGKLYSYLVTRVLVVGPRDTWIARPWVDQSLTLVAPHPDEASTNRLVVQAELKNVREVPSA